MSSAPACSIRNSETRSSKSRSGTQFAKTFAHKINRFRRPFFVHSDRFTGPALCKIEFFVVDPPAAHAAGYIRTSTRSGFADQANRSDPGPISEDQRLTIQVIDFRRPFSLPSDGFFGPAL